jgi:two-component system, chemotaxis family, CheB/CheR fusion protein
MGEIRRDAPEVWESLELYRRIVESARDFAIFTVNLKNRVTFWNPGCEKIMGFSEREAIGMSGAEIFVPEDRAKGDVEKELARARRDGKAQNERWHLRKDGSRFWGSGLMMLLRDEKQKQIGWMKILRDLTERKTAQDQLIELNRTLEERVRERTAELHELARRLTRTERLERERIAADLHDNLGQLLAFAQMKLAGISAAVDAPEAVVEPAQEVREYLDEAVSYTRALMSSLTPPGLGRGGLVVALKWLACDMAKHGVKVSFVNDRAKKVVTPDVQAVVFQAVRELLCNVKKHSRVAKAAVRVMQQNGALRVEVIDEGVGFGRSKQVEDERGGFGLFHVQERLKLFGGSLEIDRKRKRGTKVIVTAPLEPKRHLRKRKS